MVRVSSGGERMHRRVVASVVASVLAGAVAAGCSSKNGGLFLDAGELGVSSAMPSVVGLALSEVALRSSLTQMGALPPGQAFLSPPSVSTNGSATSGTLVFDFGSSVGNGTEVDEVDLRGLMQATYARSGSSATISLAFSGLTADADLQPRADVTGTLTIACTIGASYSGTITGALTLTSGGDVSTVSFNLSFTSSTGAVLVTNGTTTLASSARGAWTASFLNVSATMDPPHLRSIDSGTIIMTATSGTTLSVTLQFTGPSQGVTTVSPGNDVAGFKL
jgi:hypothetical protein